MKCWKSFAIEGVLVRMFQPWLVPYSIADYGLTSKEAFDESLKWLELTCTVIGGRDIIGDVCILDSSISSFQRFFLPLFVASQERCEAPRQADECGCSRGWMNWNFRTSNTPTSITWTSKPFSRWGPTSPICPNTSNGFNRRECASFSSWIRSSTRRSLRTPRTNGPWRMTSTSNGWIAPISRALIAPAARPTVKTWRTSCWDT